MSTWNRAMPTIGVGRGDYEQRIAALEKRLAALEKVVAVDQSGNVTIKASSFTLDSSSTVKLKGNSTLTLLANGTLEIKGSVVNLNGGRPVARMGDTVTINGPVGIITSGNPTVMG